MANERINEGPSPAEIKELNEKYEELKPTVEVRDENNTETQKDVFANKPDTESKEKKPNNKNKIVAGGLGVILGTIGSVPGTEVSTSADGNQLNKNPNQIVEKMPGGSPSEQAMIDFFSKNNLEIGSMWDSLKIPSAEAAVSTESNNDVDLYFKIGSKKYIDKGVEKNLIIPVYLNKEVRAMAPVRIIAEKLGKRVDYDGAKKEVYFGFSKEEKEYYLSTGKVLDWKDKMIMKWGERWVIKDGKKIQINSTVEYNKEGVTTASIRDVMELFDCIVVYVAGGHIYITKNSEVTNPPPTETENQTPEYKARKVLYDEMQKVIVGKPGVTRTINNDYLGIHTTYSGVNVLHLDKSDVENYLKTGTATGFEAIKDGSGMDVAIKMKNEFGLGKNEKAFDEAISWLRNNDEERFNRVIGNTKFFASNWGAYGMVESVGDGTWNVYYGSSIVAIQSTLERSWDSVLKTLFVESVAIEKCILGWSARDGGVEKGNQLIEAAQNWFDKGLMSSAQAESLKFSGQKIIEYYKKNY